MHDETKLKAEVCWNFYAEHCVHGRHHESQRSTVITVILGVAAAAAGIATLDDNLGGMTDVVIGLFIVFLGIFGAGFSLKHYERFNFHMERARSYRDELDALILGRPIGRLRDEADRRHEKRFPKMRKWRLHRWWVALNISVSVVGALLIITACLFPTQTSSAYPTPPIIQNPARSPAAS